MFLSRDSGVFPTAFEQTGLFQPIERLVQCAVGGKTSRGLLFLHLFGNQEAVKLGGSPAAKNERGFEYRDFKRDEKSRFSTHGQDYRKIYSYLSRGYDMW